MSESIEIKKDIEVTVRCSECGEQVSFTGSGDNWGDIELYVDICDCMKQEEE